MKKRQTKAQIYDQLERANDHGLGHPGPLRWRKPRAKVNGNSARLRRLRKQAPALHAKVLAGEITVWEAVTMAGFNRPQQHKPVVEHTITRLQEMELWLGPSRHGSLFASEEERRRAWFDNRDRLMRYFANNGRRPIAWWKYESPVPWPGLGLARSTLWAAGLLSAAEIRELERDWREAFDQSLLYGFTFQGLTGRDAHIAYLVFHDVPADLAEQWAAMTPEAA